MYLVIINIKSALYSLTHSLPQNLIVRDGYLYLFLSAVAHVAQTHTFFSQLVLGNPMYLVR